MSFNRHIAAAAALALFGSLQAAHAQDLKPLQAEVDNLKQQVSRLQADLTPAKPETPPKPPGKPSRPAPATKGTFATGSSTAMLTTARH